MLAANEKDMRAGEERKLSKAMLDRLKLDEGRIDGIVSALNAIAELTDPVGQTIAQWDRCLLYTSPSPRDQRGYRMPSSA